MGGKEITGHGIPRGKGHHSWGHWGHNWGLGNLPWGHKQWGMVLGHHRGPVGTFLNWGTLLPGLAEPGIGRGSGGRGRTLALPPIPGWRGEGDLTPLPPTLPLRLNLVMAPPGLVPGQFLPIDILMLGTLLYPFVLGWGGRPLTSLPPTKVFHHF